jgi:hypothetical protein
MEHLEPRSSCCLDLLCTKIGSNLIVCKKCDNEYYVISDLKLNTSLENIRYNMRKAKSKDQKQYWCGFIGGMRYTRQIGVKDF